MTTGNSGRVSEPPSAIDFGACSDVGRIRSNNEDSYLNAPDLDLFVLSDGMGGHASGEVASRLATETIVAHCREAESNPALPLAGARVDGASNASNRLASAVRLANRAIRQAAERNPDQQGMGATVVAARFWEDRVAIAHAGDSRAYRLRFGQIEQLTADHSFVADQVRRGAMTAAQAEASQFQSVLLRALGMDDEIEVALAEELVLDEDTFLLCSDGLTRELSEAQIASVLANAGDPQNAAEELVGLANQAGGGDNITAMVLRRAARPVGTLARIGRWFRDSGIG